MAKSRRVLCSVSEQLAWTFNKVGNEWASSGDLSQTCRLAPTADRLRRGLSLRRMRQAIIPVVPVTALSAAMIR